MQLNLNDTFNTQLPADKNTSNTRRQVTEACFSYVTPRVPSDPKLLHFSDELLTDLGLSHTDIQSETFLKIVSGTSVYPNTKPFAMCYGGHQFGNWAGQLGDGRAINLFETNHENQQFAWQLKGAGETPYSRTADGLAVLRSSIREHLCSEAMYHLGVPTTRSLSLVLTGDSVLRDIMYNGNSAYEPGAIVCRIAPSFIRFGNFQLLASRNDLQTLKQLADYTLKNFCPHIQLNSNTAYVALFKEVADRTLNMILDWQRVGFVHGVMNTDNLSILGLTIDYGPFGWLDNYDPNFTPNTTDNQHKRYRYENQPQIGLWNLLQLANALYPLVEEAAPFEEILNNYQTTFEAKYQHMMLTKIGIQNSQETDSDLIQTLENVLTQTETDMTIFFRLLADVKKDNTNTEEVLHTLNEAFYTPEAVTGIIKETWINWLQTYQQRLQSESFTDSQRKQAMNAINPKYILRNYMAQLAIEAAEKEDYHLISELYILLKNPYSEQPDQQKWFAKRPDWARDKIGCSRLSCSS